MLGREELDELEVLRIGEQIYVARAGVIFAGDVRDQPDFSPFEQLEILALKYVDAAKDMIRALRSGKGLRCRRDSESFRHARCARAAQLGDRVRIAIRIFRMHTIGEQYDE